MTALLAAVLAFAGPPAEPRWVVELEVEAIGGDIDVMHVDPGGGVWLGITGETTREGRARLYSRGPDGVWMQRWEGPTATDLSLSSVRSGEVYFGFNQPLAGFRPNLLRVGSDGVTRLEAPADRLDALEYRQVGTYFMWADDDGWAAGQDGGLWRRTPAGWEAQPDPFPPDAPNAQRYGFRMRFDDHDFGVVETLFGTAARWDGDAWRMIDPLPGREPRFLTVSHGLAADTQGLMRYDRSGWIALEDACGDFDLTGAARGWASVDELGRVILSPEHVVDVGSTTWTCRRIDVPFAPRAVATHEGDIWALGDDAVRRLAVTDVPTFVPGPVDALPSGLRYPFVADLDDDGDDDVLVAAGAESNNLPSSQTKGVLARWRASGEGAFAREPVGQRVEVRLMPRQVVVADFDGDGSLDASVLVMDEEVVLIRDVAGAWPTPERLGPGRYGLTAVDYEGDGDVDVTNASTLFVNDGAGHFTELPHPFPDYPGGYWYDHDLDGDADFIATTWRDPSIWMRHDGADWTRFDLGVAVEAATLGDPDLDGWPDVLAQRLHIYHLAMPFRRCTLRDGAACDQQDLGSVPAGIVGDLDRDGREDRIVGSLRVDERPPGIGDVYLAREDGFVEVTAQTGRLEHATLLDADGDGDLDVYTFEEGLRINTSNPAGVVWLQLRTARSDRRAEGAWVVLRDAEDRVVASGRSRGGTIRLGVPDVEAAYDAEVVFPNGSRRRVSDIVAGPARVISEYAGARHVAGLVALWWKGGWLRLHPLRDLGLLLLVLLVLPHALTRLGLRRRRRRVLLTTLALAPPCIVWAAWTGGSLPWLASPVAGAAAVGLAAAGRWLRARTASRRAGPFTLLERLGEGSAAVVWRARRGGEEVALKLFAAEPMRDAESRERFFREARIGAELDHPNLVRIRGSGQLDDGRCYLAMERVRGESLEHRLAVDPAPSFDEARRVLRDVAEALQALHEAGVVHRDVKPANVIVRPDRGAVLMDLGLARSALFKTVTRHELAVGTLAYMSPEQSLGRPLDGRTDLWSLGVVAYELLAGRRPFDGGHELELLYVIHNVEPAPISELRPDVPDDLRQVVEGCLRRDPDDRLRDAGAVLELLKG